MSEAGEELRRTQAAFIAAATDQHQDALDGRVIVVTGGARGLGRSLVEGLLQAGASVVSIDRTWSGAEEFRAALASDKKAMALDADVSDDAALDQALSEVLKNSGPGTDPYGPVLGCMSSWLTGHGMLPRRLPGPGGQTVALVCEIAGGWRGPRYALDACLDTAPFGDQAAWTHPPGIRTDRRRVAKWPRLG